MDLRIKAVKTVTTRVVERVRVKRPMRVVLSVHGAPYLVDPKFFTECGEVAAQRRFEPVNAAAQRLIMATVRERPEPNSFCVRESGAMATKPTLFVFWFPPSEWSLAWVPHLPRHLINVREHRAHEERQRRHSKMAYLDRLFAEAVEQHTPRL